MQVFAMKLAFSRLPEEKTKADVLIAGVHEKDAAGIAALDKALRGEISGAVKKNVFKGEYKQILLLSSAGRIAADRLIVVGLGKRDDFTAERLRRAAGAAAKAAKRLKAKSIATSLHEYGSAHDVAEAMLLALYDFRRYKTEKNSSIEAISFTGAGDAKHLHAAAETAEAVNYVRDLVNTPSADKPPEMMAKEARKLKKVRVRVFGKRELERMGLNCLLAVGKGSVREPKLVVADYNPRAKKTVALVGKGVVFDSGGLNLKPSQYMLTMKSDMAGAATVLGVMKLLRALGVKARVVGVMPLCENMPSGSAARPGDIVVAHNKKSIEISDTDAEGRLILADALSYAERAYKPDIMIDLATLTGACVVALGYEAAGVWGDKEVVEKLKRAAAATGERVWEMPLYEEYSERMKGEISDLRSISKGKGYEAGACTAAAFLKNFAGKAKWAHLDIAGTSWFVEDGEYTPAGATGYGVRLLARMLRDL